MHEQLVVKPIKMEGTDIRSSRTELKRNLPPLTCAALEFDESRYAKGSVSEDPFYAVSELDHEKPAGALLRVEQAVDTSLYMLPPATAMSRIVFQSKTMLGSLVPVSAYVLWPYAPRMLSDGAPIVAWAHGTSGIAADCAPSHLKNLWQHFLAPYQLALQGYVVVAADYAGLGVQKNGLGQFITHEYLSGPSQANDVLYSVQAAQQAFSELSKEFVVIGHSQGGGAAWAVAEKQAAERVDGYLGSVAISPVLEALAEPGPFLSILGAAICPATAALFPQFDPKTVLTEEGIKRFDLSVRAGGCSATGLSLLMEAELFKPDWTKNQYIQRYKSLTSTGGKQLEGPLLVIHGASDGQISASVTSSVVEKTTALYPSSQIDYIVLADISHVPSMPASQSIWMNWIADRFAKKPVAAKKTRSVIQPNRSAASYQAEINWYIEPGTQFYQTIS